MSNTELTPKHELTAQMVAAYGNAQVLEISTGKINAVSRINLQFNSILASTSIYRVVYGNTRFFKLVLTSPSNITDAQAMEVGKNFFTQGDVDLETMRLLFDNLHQEDAVKVKFNDFRELLHTCMLNNIDMGYGSIPSLIAAGLAVEAKTVQP